MALDLEKWSVILELSSVSLQPRLSATAEESSDGHTVDTLNVDQNVDKILNTLKTINSCHYFGPEAEGKYSIYLSKLVILLGEQLATGHDGDLQGCHWTTKLGRLVSTKIIQQINRIFNFKDSKDIGQLFFHDFQHHCASKEDDWIRKTLFWPIIVDFKAKLKRAGSSGLDIALDQEWKYYPAAQNSFCWILKYIKSPYLSQFLEFVLPPTLLFLDDYNDANVLMGFQCLSHILENSNDADMVNCNRGKVIYSALIRLLSSKNPQIIDYLVPIILKILAIIEKDPNVNASRFSQYDDVMKLILFGIEFGTSGDHVQLRKTWLSNLQLILKVLGLSTLHWSDKILAMLLDFSVSNDPQIWTLILQNLQLVLKNTWTNPDIDQMLEIILRILFNSSVFQMDQDNIMSKITITLQLIETCSPEFRQEINIILEKFDQKLHPQFILGLNELMERMKLEQK